MSAVMSTSHSQCHSNQSPKMFDKLSIQICFQCCENCSSEKSRVPINQCFVQIDRLQCGHLSLSLTRWDSVLLPILTLVVLRALYTSLCQMSARSRTVQTWECCVACCQCMTSSFRPDEARLLTSLSIQRAGSQEVQQLRSHHRNLYS